MNSIDYLIEKHLKSHELFVENPLWTIKKSSLGGRGLFSSRDIEAGEVIFKDSPLIIGPRVGKTCPIVCINCYGKDDLYPCSNNCGLPVCSKKCQNSASHKNECNFIARVNKYAGFSKIETKLVKCLTPVRSVFLSDHQKELLLHLTAHMGSQHGHEVDILQKELQLNLSEGEEFTMRLTCSILDANSFEVIVGNEDNQSSLRGLFPLSSLMNHNCVPNTMHIFNKHQNMIVKATTFIPAGQELFHCYTRLFWGTSVRRPHLVITKHFFCTCARCEDPTEFGTNMSAIKCLKCSEIVLPYFVNRTKMIWKCTSCQDIISNEKAGFLISVFASSLNTFETSTVESVLKFIKEKLLNHLTASSQIVLELKYKLLWIIGYDEKYLWKEKHLQLNNAYEPQPSWSIREFKLDGNRGLFANRDIKSGEIIFKDSPLIIGPRLKEVHPSICVTCHKPTSMACGNGCFLPVCSKACEISQVHISECLFINRYRKEESQNENVLKCLAPLRFFWLNDFQKELIMFLKFDKTSQSDIEFQILNDRFDIKFCESEKHFFHLACSVLNVNAFEVVVGNETEKYSLRGLYPLASMMNHSCIPNAENNFDENQNMIVKSTRFIHAGEEILVCYTKLLWNTLIRRVYLLKTKQFVCDCNRCNDPTEFQTNLGNLNCLVCDKSITPLLDKFKLVWRCNLCQNVMSMNKVGIIFGMLANRLNSLENNVENILNFLKSDILKYVPSSSYIVMEMKYKLVWIIGHQDPNYFLNDISTELLNEKENICRELLELLNMLSAGQCKMRGLLLYELYSCIKESQRRRCSEENTKDNLQISQEMWGLLEESKDILMDDVHAPKEIKMLSSSCGSSNK